MRISKSFPPRLGLSRYLKHAGLLAALALPACSAGVVEKGVDHVAIPDQEECNPLSLDVVMNPLVMKWPTSARADIESALQDGVVVVRYTCDSVKVLQDCRVEGDYGYRALTPKSDEVLIEGRDNIRASFGGGLWSVDASIDRGSKLDLSYRLVGKRATVRNAIAEDELPDNDFCKGATHFVKRVDLGAWTLVAGKDIKAGLAAEVMMQGVDSGSEHREVLTKTDGSLDACKGASNEDKSSPSGCGALIRVTLAPIKKELSKSDNVLAHGTDTATSCPTGFSATSRGGCVAGTTDDSICEVGDEAGCAKKCGAGDRPSCGRFANAVLYGGASRGEIRKKLADKSVSSMFDVIKAACVDDHIAACALGAKMILGRGQGNFVSDRKALLPLLEKGCVGGDPSACVDYSSTLNLLKRMAKRGSDSELAKDVERLSRTYITMLYRGCVAGGAGPCGQQAFEFAAGGNLRQRGEEAAKQAKKACLGNNAQACVLLAALSENAARCKVIYGALPIFTRNAFKQDAVCSEKTLAAANVSDADRDMATKRACTLGAAPGCK